MKKAIRLIVVVLAICICAVSCKKTINTIVISGKWELVRTVVTENGQKVFDQYSPEQHVRTYFAFNSGDAFVKTTVSIDGESYETGRWIVDDDILLLTYAGKSERYYIDKAGLFELILVESYTQAGVSVERTLYLESITTAN